MIRIIGKERNVEPWRKFNQRRETTLEPVNVFTDALRIQFSLKWQNRGAIR